jgi:hypothetical protein
MLPSGSIGIPRAAQGHGDKNDLAGQRITSAPARPSVFQRDIHPLLEQGRSAIHVKGEMPDQNVMLRQKRLFAIGIDVEVRIMFIQVVDRHALHPFNARKQRAIVSGLFKPRMGKENEDFVHEVSSSFTISVLISAMSS